MTELPPEWQKSGYHVGDVCVVATVKGFPTSSSGGTWRLARVVSAPSNSGLKCIKVTTDSRPLTAIGVPYEVYKAGLDPYTHALSIPPRRPIWRGIGKEVRLPETVLRARECWLAWTAMGQPAWHSYKTCAAFVARYMQEKEVA
jgi:hypothetical protein